MAAVRCRRAKLLRHSCQTARTPTRPCENQAEVRATESETKVWKHALMRATLHPCAPNTYYGQWPVLFLREERPETGFHCP